MINKATWLSRTLGENSNYVAPSRPWPKTLRRVLGEDDPASVGDAPPPRPEPGLPPKPNRPDDSDFSSMADLEQDQANQDMEADGGNDALQQAITMWRSGGKYDAADFILNSEFSYADLIGLIQQLEPEESMELGTILDEISPPESEKEQAGTPPTDMVSAAAGAPPLEAAEPEAEAEPALEPET